MVQYRMTSALLCLSRQLSAPQLQPDLAAAGVRVLLVQREITNLVQNVVIHAPDVVIVDNPSPNSHWFQAIHILAQSAPCPVLMFTSDTDSGAIELATQSEVHVYVMNGYGANRLRSLIYLAQVRFRHVQAQRKAFDEIATRFEERKDVDRAKGILMQHQQLSDDDAFRVLRSQAMRSNQRLGQLSKQVIQSAHLAEAVNRAGQLRMLSQRVVKLHLLVRADVQRAHHAQLLAQSIQWVDTNVAHLRSSLSLPTFGDLLDQVVTAWSLLKDALTHHDGATAMDAHAEALLQGAERLTANLESAGQTPPLHVLNLAGRQRMLSQRYAKGVLQSMDQPSLTPLTPLAPSAPPEPTDVLAVLQATQQEFEAALTYLNALPLRSTAIQEGLREAGIAWVHLVAAARTLAPVQGRARAPSLDALAQSSESLLQLFDALAAHYEHSLDMLLS